MRQQVSKYQKLSWISRGLFGVGAFLACTATQAAATTSTYSARHSELTDSRSFPGLAKIWSQGDVGDGFGTELGSGKDELMRLALREGVSFGEVLEDVLSSYLSRTIGRLYGQPEWQLELRESKDVEATRAELLRQARIDGWDVISVGKYTGAKHSSFTVVQAESLVKESFATKFLFGDLLVDIKVEGRASGAAVSPSTQLMNRLQSLRLFF